VCFAWSSQGRNSRIIPSSTTIGASTRRIATSRRDIDVPEDCEAFVGP